MMAPRLHAVGFIVAYFFGLHVAALPPAAGHRSGHYAAPSHFEPHAAPSHYEPNDQPAASSTANATASSSYGVATASTTASTTATSISPYTSAGFTAFTDMNSAQLHSVYSSYTYNVWASANSGISSMSAQASALCAGMDYVASYYMSSLTTASASTTASTSTTALSETASATPSVYPRALFKRVVANEQSCSASNGVDLGGNVVHYTVDIGLPFDNDGGCSAIQNALGGMLSNVGFSFFECNALPTGNDVFTVILFKVNLVIGNGAKINAALESVTRGRVNGGFNFPDL